MLKNIVILAFDPIFEYQGRAYAEVSFEEKVRLYVNGYIVILVLVYQNKAFERFRSL